MVAHCPLIYRRSGEFIIVFSSVIMLNAISRGRQFCFMSFSALLCAQSFLVQHWDTATVDQILIEGDRMHLKVKDFLLLQLFY